MLTRISDAIDNRTNALDNEQATITVSLTNYLPTDEQRATLLMHVHQTTLHTTQHQHQLDGQEAHT